MSGHSMNEYMAHGFCFLWDPSLVRLHVVSDIITGLSYYAIAMTLFYFSYKRRDLPFVTIFVLFGFSIFLACGTTHLFAAYTVYSPEYWKEGGVKAVTAFVSIISAIMFIPIIPKAIALPSLTKALDENRNLNSALEKQVEELHHSNRSLQNEIAERKKTEAAFAESELRYRILADSGQALIWTSGPDKLYDYFNEPWLLFTGRALEQELGNGWAEGVHPDDLARCLETYNRAFEKREQFSLEYRLRHASGEYQWILDDGKPRFDGKGNFLGYIGHCLNITERKRMESALRASEEKYRTLIQEINDGVFVMDERGNFTFVNNALARIHGYEKPDDLVGKNFVELTSPEGREALMQEFSRNIESGRDPGVLDVPIERPDKSRAYIQVHPVNIIENGRVVGTRGIVRDITEHRKLAEQLRHAQKMEAIGTLAGGVAHDFNNILNVIMGYGSMVLDKMGPDDSSREQMHEVLAATERAATLTKRLLVFSRKQVVEVKPVDINGIITGVQKMLSRVIGEDIDLQVNLADKRLTVMADAGQIEQVLMNLAANARDAMPKGGHLTITTDTAQMDDAYVAAYGYGKTGAYAVIVVADTGKGMDAETQTKIFEPFFTTKGIGEGTGLGLAISYGIVKQHNGYINCYSETGKGTIFKIYLSLIEDTSASGIKKEAPDAIKGGTETILVAEDDPSLRKLDRIVLKSFGYSVILAEDGEDAVTKFMENRDKIKLVILDMVMPKKNGKEAYEEIKKMSPGIRTFFLSGYTMDMISRMEIQEGMEVLRKPVAPNDLLRKVREVLDRNKI